MIAAAIAAAACGRSAPPSTNPQVGPTPLVASASAFPSPAASPLPSASPSASAALPPVVTPKRGLWVWEFDNTSPSLGRSVELAAAMKFPRVYLKCANGAAAGRWPKNCSEKNVAAFEAKGIEVWAFAYVYPDDQPDAKGQRWGSLDEQIARIAEVMRSPHLSGLVVDAEGEFEKRPDEATKLCAALRPIVGARPLAYTTFGWLAIHPDFPYEAFDRGCGDAFLPQVYWAFGWPGGVGGSFERLTRDVKKRGLAAPLWPIGSIERDPDPGETRDFLTRAGDGASIFYLHEDGSPQNAHLRAALR